MPDRYPARAQPGPPTLSLLPALIPLLIAAAFALATGRPSYLLFGAMAPVIAGANLVSARYAYSRRPRRLSPLERMTDALGDLAGLTAELDREVRERSELVARLRRDSERYAEIAALKKEEADAVVQMLQRELGRTELRGYIVNGCINLVVAAAAFGLGLWVS